MVGRGGYRAQNAWRQKAWKEERDKEKANNMTQKVRRGAALPPKLAARSEKKMAKVCKQPPSHRDFANAPPTMK